MTTKNLKINANGYEISVIAYENQNDYISITDIAKQKNADACKCQPKNGPQL